MVNLPPDLEGPALARARAENRSLANYIENLISRDVRESGSASPFSTGAATGADLGSQVIAAALKKKTGGR